MATKKKIKPEEKTHSVYSASGSERWLNCPGSIREIAKAPIPEDSEAGMEGTKAHLLLELWLRHLQTKLGSFIFPKQFAEESEMKKNVGFAIKEIQKLVKREKLSLKHSVKSERKVYLSHIHEEMSGTLDVEIYEDYGTLRVWDYKNGRKKVKVKNPGPYGHNTQLIYYALAAAHEHRYEFTDVEIGIVQPRVKLEVQTAKLSVKQLRGYEELFRKGVDRTLKKNAPLHLGEWCFFCPAKFQCPKMKSQARERNLQNAQLEFDII